MPTTTHIRSDTRGLEVRDIIAELETYDRKLRTNIAEVRLISGKPSFIHASRLELEDLNDELKHLKGRITILDKELKEKEQRANRIRHIFRTLKQLSRSRPLPLP